MDARDMMRLYFERASAESPLAIRLGEFVADNFDDVYDALEDRHDILNPHRIAMAMVISDWLGVMEQILPGSIRAEQSIKDIVDTICAFAQHKNPILLMEHYLHDEKLN
jgi:hypothetical protein